MTGIRERLDELLAETTLSDPHAIAKRIVDELNSRELRPALNECLPAFVRNQLGRERLRPLVPDDSIDGASSHFLTGSLGTSRSSKWANARSVFTWRVRGQGGYKLLGHCSLTDVEFAAESRRKKAKELEAWGDKFDALAALMRERKVESVGQLSEAEVSGVLA